jgi:uncharacterized protein YndB with AHSA1/START domain
MTSAPILRSVTVSVDQHRAFSVFTDEVAAWWPTQSHGIFGPACGRVAFENGLIIERATDGEQVVWGEVLAWEPPDRLCFTWHPGRTADDSSEVEVRFVDTGSATRVEIEHRGWERFGAEASARRRGYIGPGTWGAVLEHYADVAEPTTDAADLLSLATAYEAFYLEAERGGFGAPPDGEWDALRTIAHVALNDYAMTAVTQSILHGTPTTFENVICQDPAVLEAHIERYAGDLSALVDHGEVVQQRFSPSWGASAPTNALLRWPAGCITTEPSSWTPNARGRRSPSRCRRPGTCRRTPASWPRCAPEPQTRYSARTNNTRARSRRSSRRRPSGANRIPYSACRAELIAVASLVSAASTHGSETPLLSRVAIHP